MKPGVVLVLAILAGVAGGAAVWFALDVSKQPAPRAGAEGSAALADRVTELATRLETAEQTIARLRARRPVPDGDAGTSPGDSGGNAADRGGPVVPPAPTADFALRLDDIEARNRELATAFEDLKKRGSKTIISISEADLVRALDNADSNVRRKSLEALRKLGSDKGVDAAVRFATDADAKVRREAAEYFEVIRDPRGQAVLAALLKDEDRKVASRAASALRKRGDEASFALLEDAYEHGDNPRVAYEVGKELAKGERTAVFPRGVERWRTLLSDAEPDNRRLGIAGLRRFGTAADASAVRPLLEDADSRVRRDAARAIAGWGQ